MEQLLSLFHFDCQYRFVKSGKGVLYRFHNQQRVSDRPTISLLAYRLVFH